MSEELLQQVHDDWKEKGFPYYPKDADWRNHILGFAKKEKTSQYGIFFIQSTN